MIDYIQENILILILTWIALAELSIQIVTSELSAKIKGAMLLQMPYNSKTDLLSKNKFWRKLLGRYWVLATPFILFFAIHKFIAELLDCPYCIGFWIGLFTNHFYLNLDWITSIILAPMVLIGVAVLDRIHTR